MSFYFGVYILKCSDQTYYTGFTSDITSRIKAHGNGEVKYTRTRLPISLELYIQFKDKQKAYDFERYLKTGSGIAFRNKRLIKLEQRS